MGMTHEMGEEWDRDGREGGEDSPFSHRLRESRDLSAVTTSGSGWTDIRHPNVLAEGLGWGLGLSFGFWVALGLLLRAF